MKHLPLLSIVIASFVAIAGCGGSGSGGPTVEADLTVTPDQGTVLTEFEFDAGGSTVSGRALSFRWDWNGDGTWDTAWSSEPTATRRFAQGGTITVRVQVTDGSDTDTHEVSVAVDGRHGHMDDLFDVPVTASPHGITDDGDHIWITNWIDATYKLDAITGDSLGTLPRNSAWTGGAAWNGEYLCTTGWAGGSRIFKQNPTTGDFVGSIPVIYSADMSGLDWDPEAGVFYYGSSVGTLGGDGHIHRYSTDGIHLSSFPSPRGSQQPRAVAFDGVNVWVAISQTDSLFVVDPDDGDVLRVVPAPGRIRGIHVMDDHVIVILENPFRLARMVP